MKMKWWLMIAAACAVVVVWANWDEIKANLPSGIPFLGSGNPNA